MILFKIIFFTVCVIGLIIRELGGFGESGPDSPSLSDSGKRGARNRAPPGKREPVQGLFSRFWTIIFLHPMPKVRLSVYGQISAKKSGGGGSHGASITPRWGGTPPLVGVLHGINSKA